MLKNITKLALSKSNIASTYDTERLLSYVGVENYRLEIVQRIHNMFEENEIRHTTAYIYTMLDERERRVLNKLFNNKTIEGLTIIFL